MSLLTLNDPTLDRFERLFSPLSRRFFPFDKLTDSITTPTSYMPNIDLSEDDDNFYVLAELPGMKEADVKVKLDGDVITISGKKERNEEKKDRNYYSIERSFGEFARAMRLPDNVKAESIVGNMTDGLLELTLPKKQAEKSKIREIPLKGTTASNGHNRPS